ncbi:hypothetical protein Tco_0352913, partial [Tanacetum coccineum]
MENADLNAQLPEKTNVKAELRNLLYMKGKSVDTKFLALGWHLEETHVTWAHFEKKRTKETILHYLSRRIVQTERGDGVAGIKRRRRDLSSDDVIDLTTASGPNGNLKELSGEEAWEAIENFTQCQKEWDNPPNIISKQEVANLKAQAKRLLYLMRRSLEVLRKFHWMILEGGFN